MLLDTGALVLRVDISAAALQAAADTLDGGECLTRWVSALATPASAADALDAAVGPLHGNVHMAGLFEHDPLDPADRSAYACSRPGRQPSPQRVSSSKGNCCLTRMTVQGAFMATLIGTVATRRCICRPWVAAPMTIMLTWFPCA